MKWPDFFICWIASLNFFAISCTYIMCYFFRFDKELNKEVAIEPVDLEEAWVPNMNFTMCLSWGIKDQPTLHLATYQTSSDEVWSLLSFMISFSVFWLYMYWIVFISHKIWVLNCVVQRKYKHFLLFLVQLKHLTWLPGSC